MKTRKHPPSRNLRDIGQVVSHIDKMNEAREISSCCVGVEAALETDIGFNGLKRRLSEPHHSVKKMNLIKA